MLSRCSSFREPSSPPQFAVVTPGKTADIEVARTMRFEPGTLLVFRGYQDFGWWMELTRQGVFFITRPEDNAQYGVVEQRLADRERGTVRDEIILLVRLQEKGPDTLMRRIAVEGEGGETVVFVTNHLKPSAATVAAVYRERWQFELRFRALKQTLRIKTFVGTSANAVLIQIGTALIAMLLVKYLQMRSQYGWSLSNLVALLRQQLFVYRDLQRWLDHPFEPPPQPLGRQQLALGWDSLGQQMPNKSGVWFA